VRKIRRRADLLRAATMSGRDALPIQQAHHDASPWLWWWREFRGTRDQVREVRHWIQGLLPGGEPLDELTEIASELATNTLLHTNSGLRGAGFGVQLAWSPSRLRVAVGDMGSDSEPVIVPASDEPGEGGRGLWIVARLSANWGVSGGADGRWVWSDVLQGAPGASLRAPASGNPTALEQARLARAFPGGRIWFGGVTRTWWAMPSGTRELIEAPSPAALHQMLAMRRPSRPTPVTSATPTRLDPSRFVAAPVAPAAFPPARRGPR
jgi:serine/threonine-protein kinase RsbW